jgi:serine/threonine protein kinase
MCIVMTDAMGCDLHEAAIRGVMKLSHSREAIAAIEELHRLGYFHGDVKPENFVISASGDVWLIDFESAGKPGCDSPSCPTAAFSSPEKGTTGASREDDCWGLGAALYVNLERFRPPIGFAKFLMSGSRLWFSQCTPEKMRRVIAGLLTCEVGKRLTAEVALAIMDGRVSFKCPVPSGVDGKGLQQE